MQLELSTHPFRKGETYNQQVGNAAMERVGKKKWSSRVEKAIAQLRSLTRFDRLYIGGGNASQLKLDLPKDVTRGDNSAALLGAVRMWEWDVE